MPPATCTCWSPSASTRPRTTTTAAVRQANRAAVRKAIGIGVEGRDPVVAARLVADRDALRNPFYGGG